MPDKSSSQPPTSHADQHSFTASEMAEYEYCPLAWWYARYEPHTEFDTEELFAELVEMEHAYGAQATALPEYRLIEQLLVQRGAFEEGRAQHLEHAQQVAANEDIAEIEEERQGEPGSLEQFAHLRLVILIMASAGIVCIILAIILATH